MKTIRSPTDVGIIAHVGIRTIVDRRICELRLIPPETLPDLGVFIVAEVGDTINQLEQAAGCCLFYDLDGTPYGDPEFSLVLKIRVSVVRIRPWAPFFVII